MKKRTHFVLFVKQKNETLFFPIVHIFPVVRNVPLNLKENVRSVLKLAPISSIPYFWLSYDKPKKKIILLVQLTFSKSQNRFAAFKIRA